MGTPALEVTWTIVPTILILGLGFWSVFTLFYLDEPPTDQGEVLDVVVTGHQWYFEFEYPDAGGGKAITTANELRIPVRPPDPPGTAERRCPAQLLGAQTGGQSGRGAHPRTTTCG